MSCEPYETKSTGEFKKQIHELYEKLKKDPNVDWTFVKIRDVLRNVDSFDDEDDETSAIIE